MVVCGFVSVFLGMCTCVDRRVGRKVVIKVVVTTAK